MLTPYRIEIFNRADISFKCFAPIVDKVIKNDYLTSEKSSVTVLSLDAEKGDFAQIVGENGTVYQGIVEDIDIDNEIKVSLQPLFSVFDCNIFIGSQPSGTIEQQLGSLIDSNFIHNSDLSQNLPIVMEIQSSTVGALALENVENLNDVIVTAFTTYGIVVDISFNPNGSMSLQINKYADERVIEADLREIIERSFVIGDNYGEINKLFCYDSDGNTATYYRHPNGDIDSNDTNRIIPVFSNVKEIRLKSGEVFGDVAYANACQVMKAKEYNNEITLKLRESSKVIPPMKMGQRVSIIRSGVVYESMLTGYELKDEIITYIFGCVRISLTKRLIIERRANS